MYTWKWQNIVINLFIIFFAEIPLFHVLNARITFGNIYAADQPIPHVSCLNEGDRQTCIIDDEVFQVPPEYRVQGKFHNYFTFYLLLAQPFT